MMMVLRFTSTVNKLWYGVDEARRHFLETSKDCQVQGQQGTLTLPFTRPSSSLLKYPSSYGWSRALHTPPSVKRECSSHDPAFSPWKLLIRPRDWEADDANGKRYRIENLPDPSVGPSVYELAAAIPLLPSSQEYFLFATVYVGSSDNVRKRLQCYGRDGAHLRNTLFTDIFSRGVSIAYRYIPMKSHAEAKKTELQLQRSFNYAWNGLNNGPRRPQDIHRILPYVVDLQLCYQIKTCAKLV